MISYLYANAISQANQIIVGHLIGAREENEAFAAVIDTLKKSMPVSIVSLIKSLQILEFFRKKSSKTVIIAYEYQYSLFFSKIPLNFTKNY